MLLHGAGLPIRYEPKLTIHSILIRGNTRFKNYIFIKQYGSLNFSPYPIPRSYSCMVADLCYPLRIFLSIFICDVWYRSYIKITRYLQCLAFLHIYVISIYRKSDLDIRPSHQTSILWEVHDLIIWEYIFLMSHVLN